MPFPPELISTAIGVGGATAGYAFREYRNRVRPFMQITEIDGTTTRRSDKVTIDDALAQAFTNSFYIKKLPTTCDLGSLYDHWDRADDIKQIWPLVRDDVDAVLSSSNEDEMSSAILELLKGSYFEKWMDVTIGDSSFTAILVEQVDKIHIYESDDNNGTVWFDFGVETQRFSRGLKHAAIRAKVEPWLQAIQYLHKSTIVSVLNEFRTILEGEFQLALQHAGDMRQTCNEHSPPAH